MDVNIWTYAFEPPGPAFLESDDTKSNWNEISVDPVNLTNYPEHHEVLGVIVYFTGPFTNTSPIYVNYKIYRNDIKFAEVNDQVPLVSPPDEWWNWYRVKFWSGHASWEIYGPATIRIEITLSGWASGSATLYMNVVAPIEETINWEANVPDGEHPFYLLSFYGINTNNTIAGFQIYNGVYTTITTPSMTRWDDLTTPNVLKLDCLTIIAENYDGSTVSGIYDWKIDNAVV